MRLLLVAFLAAFLSACTSLQPAVAAPAPDVVPGIVLAPQEADAAKPAEDTTPPAAEDAGRGLLTTVVLYVPNRVLDLFDVARAGVDVGPGIGVDLQVTKLVQARALSTLALGIGLQTLRHMPFRAGPEAAVGLGPLGGDAELGGWYRSPGDIRVGLHALLVGAHVAVEPVEILDFVLGFVLIDIKDDDL